MKEKDGEDRKIAIVGIGPRGSYALEQLVIELSRKNNLTKIKIFLFEETNNFGNGPVYNVDQPDSNWINISSRILLLEQRPTIKIYNSEIPAFPSFHEWSGYNKIDHGDDEVDTYPPRSYVGQYLQERFLSLYEPLHDSKIAFLKNTHVQNMHVDDEKVIFKHEQEDASIFDEILLTIGHQPVELSDQLNGWKQKTETNTDLLLFTEPYPIDRILSYEFDPKANIALRGFGLAMIDVARGLAQRYGSFIENNSNKNRRIYRSDNKSNIKLIPFSLDGLPPSPKPLNAAIDNWFKPAEIELTQLKLVLSDKKNQIKAEGIDFLIEPMLSIISKVYFSLPKILGKENYNTNDIEAITRNWLHDENYTHSIITSRNLPTYELLGLLSDMANGVSHISLDYCIGQVWRHCQPTIYTAISHHVCEEKVIADIIALDERLKRYSYGPPVESIIQLIALVDAEFLDLSYLEDPEIELSEDGWKLKKENDTVTAQVMINTVLNPPRVVDVVSPLIKKLLSDDVIEPIHSDLGIYTNEAGYAVSKSNETDLPIAILGRLAKGTIIGVDAILECFGSRPETWARKAAANHLEWLERV